MPFNSFSERIRRHPAIAVKSSSDNLRDILAVTDQILVAFNPGNTFPFGYQYPLQEVEEWCLEHGIFATRLTTVFNGLLPRAFDYDYEFLPSDAMIYKLIFPRNFFPDVFAVVDALNSAFALPPGTITPNHVLVPAPYDDHSCPSGPPSPIHPPPPKLPPPVPPFRHVTVIDSGYQWPTDPAANPLGAQPWSPAGRLKRDRWVPGRPEQLSTNGGRTLDALAGHANFITGVIRQRCPQAHVDIVNHNGGFDPAADDVPTESAVVRSLYRSAGAEVIDLGFAFVAFHNVISVIWDIALAQVGPTTPVVAPAGNQGVDDPPRYPAALGQPSILHLTYPNVIGVASSQSGAKSGFSNFGPWVKCSAYGENVHSTFLTVRMTPEDADNAVPLDFQGWAVWQGTSFAAPKVVAAIANAMGTNLNGVDAWQNMIMGRTPASGLGYVLDTPP